MSLRAWLTMFVTICGLLGVVAFAYGVKHSASTIEFVGFIAVSIGFVTIGYIFAQHGRSLS